MIRETIIPANGALDAGAVYGLPMSAGVQGGGLIFLSGLFAVDPATGLRWHGPAAEEAQRILAAMDEILHGRGSSLAQIVKLHVFMASMLEMDGVNAVCRTAFPGDPPARTMCGVALLGGGRVEMDCVALAGDEHATTPLVRSIVQPANPALNVSRNVKLPHSPGVGVGDYIVLSGMGPIDPATGERAHGPVAGQIRQTLANMDHMLQSAGSSLTRVVKVHVILANAEDYNDMNAVYREFFPHDPPARTCCVLQLSHGNACEIECIALATYPTSHGRAEQPKGSAFKVSGKAAEG